MKVLTQCALCCFAVSAYGQAVSTQLRIVPSANKNITYTINNGEPQGWTIATEAKPDRLEVECGKNGSRVAFYTGTDSAVFKVHENERIRFYILYNGDSALTELAGVPQNVRFTDAYVAAHKGKIEVEIPEVHELVNIAIALTQRGMTDSNMVDMTSDYYREVMQHFRPYVDMPLIIAMNAQLGNPDRTQAYWSYYAWKMNACAFVYKDSHIVNNGIIRNMGFEQMYNPLPDHIALMEEFAEKSGFREFYRKHSSYYSSLTELYRQMNPINKMQAWLEKYFKRQYGNYSVYFSPLVGGAHSTQRFTDNGFTQTAMFVCRPTPEKALSKAANEMRESRVVFTEIDHNFVNPISEKYFDEINRVFPRHLWADTVSGITDGYDSAPAVFNEYMTWAIFSLYCMDNFTGKDLESFLARMENQMERDRGYIRFRVFNRKLMALYKAGKPPVDQLYKQMLKWCATYAG